MYLYSKVQIYPGRALSGQVDQTVGRSRRRQNLLLHFPCACVRVVRVFARLFRAIASPPSRSEVAVIWTFGSCFAFFLLYLPSGSTTSVNLSVPQLKSYKGENAREAPPLPPNPTPAPIPEPHTHKLQKKKYTSRRKHIHH